MLLTLVILAFCVSSLVFPLALHVAHRYQIVDNPNARKLQKEPIPVMGGVVVLMGIVVPLLIAARYFHFPDLWYTTFSLILLFVVGLIDDIRGLSAVVRFLIEMLLVWVLIWHPADVSNGPLIDHVHGLFGRDFISPFTAIPLTIVAGVGLINSINLIDGVDGFSSGYGVMNNLLFACIWYHIDDMAMFAFSLIAAAAVIPFYFHNVFGRKSKMFMGDAGSLVLGMVLAINVLTLLSSDTNTSSVEEQGWGLVALTLAIAAIPVFDTLRVMTARIIMGRSPFSPDKTHLHHVFISLGFSHVGTSGTIIFLNLLIVFLWWIAYRLGCSITMQFLLVIVLGVLSTAGIYYGFRYAEGRNNSFCRFLRNVGRRTHFESGRVWLFLERLIDRTAFCR